MEDASSRHAETKISVKRIIPTESQLFLWKLVIGGVFFLLVVRSKVCYCSQPLEGDRVMCEKKPVFMDFLSFINYVALNHVLLQNVRYCTLLF